MLSTGVDNPSVRFRIIWGIGEGVIAAAWLLAGGLAALQTASIGAALPISIIMLFMTYGLLKSLHSDSSAVLEDDFVATPDGTSLKRDLRA